MQSRKRTSSFKVLGQSSGRARKVDLGGRDLPQVLAVLLVGAGMVLGGGGTSNPLSEIALEVFAAVLMLVWIVVPGDAPRPAPKLAVLISLLVVSIPLLQLVPLPPSLWHALPGREVEVAALSLIGKQDAWMPWTVAPPLTLAVLIAMVPPLAMMWFVASLDDRGRDAVIRTVVVLAIISVMLGAAQLASPMGKEPTFYRYHHEGFVIGFQANRNAEVDVLLIGLLAATTLFAARPRQLWTPATVLGYASIALLLLIGTILTGSRGGILLIPAAALMCLLMVLRGNALNKRALTAVATGSLLFAAAAWLLRHNAAIGKIAARFTTDEDARSALWTDTIFAIHQYWPFGGGMGTFAQLMTAVERLEVLDPTVPSRAHNDYLEMLLESGIFGPIVVVVSLGCLAFVSVKAWKNQSVSRAHLIFAGAAIFIVAAHSLVDYPLRSMSLAILMGGASGLLIPNASGRGPGHTLKQN